MSKSFGVLCLWFCLWVAPNAIGAQAVETAQERVKRLEGELRCLVCQNQTLADSNAPLAEDLRREVRELAASGKSDQQIRDFLVARYGDFILYKPPLKATTWLLWLGPFVLLLVGALLWWGTLRRRARQASAPALGASDSTRARTLLDEPETP